MSANIGGADAHPGRAAPTAPWEHGILAAIVAAFVATAAILVASAPGFTWDEAVYALIARHWVEGTPGTGWAPHRPLVLSLLGAVPVALGVAEEAAFRIIGLSFGAVLIAATWVVARSMAGSLSGLLAALGVASVPTLVGDAGLFLTDVPATAVLLAVVAVLWRAMERPAGPGRDLLWVAPLAALAVYVRYGSIVPLAALAFATLLVWPGKVLRGWRVALATVVLAVAFLMPHGALSVAATGSPLGILSAAQTAARPAVLGEALSTWVGMFARGELAGAVPSVLMLIGAVALVARLAIRRWPSGDALTRAMGLLVVTAVAQAAILGTLIHAESRYLFFPIILLVIGGMITVVHLALRAQAGRGALAVVVVAILATMAANPFAVRATASRMLAAYGWERELGRYVAGQVGTPCSVLATDVPQITWYAGCSAVNFGDRTREGDRDRLLVDDQRLLVLREDGLFQPTGDLLDGYLDRVEPRPVAEFRRPDGSLAATLYRFR
jgi:hypothetical protein